MCKFREAFTFPGTAKVMDDAKDDAVAVGQVIKAAHGPGSPAHPAEGPFDHVDGARFSPVTLGNLKEVQHAVQVAFDAGDRLGPALLPNSFH